MSKKIIITSIVSATIAASIALLLNYTYLGNTPLVTASGAAIGTISAIVILNMNFKKKK